MHDEEFSKQFDTSVWRKVFRLLAPYRWHYAGIMTVIVLMAGVEVLFPLVVRNAVDEGITPGNRDVILLAVFEYLGLIILQAVLVASFISGCARVGVRVIADLRRMTYDKLQSLSISYFDKTPVGWLMSRMFSDSQRVGDTLTWGAVDFVWGAVNMSLMAIAMLVVHWKLALAALSLLPLIVGISIFFQRRILRGYRSVRRINSEITAGFNEGYMGVRVIKSLVRETAMARDFETLTGKMFEASVRSAVLSSVYLPIIHVIGATGSALVIAFGGSGVIAGSISLGTLVAFISYTRRFFDPANEIARVFGQLQETQASAERVFVLLDVTPELTERPNASNDGRIRGKVEFRDVWFGYDRKNPVLRQFNLSVDPGQTIALVGPTGSGKTTVMNLLLRFYDPTRGAVLIDGEDIRQWTFRRLRSQMGVVLQTPHLFSGTVRENIRYGKLDATDDAIETAAKQVGLHEFVEALPSGYETVLREGGEPLSTGQKQLISLARAVLSDPAIFIMDEATSSVDTETELRIQQASEKLLAGRTAFIIAHRLSTIRQADRILVIEKGRIAENGTHAELMARRGMYHQLYSQQFMKS